MKKFSPNRKAAVIAVAAVCCVLSAASAIAQLVPPGTPPAPPGPPQPPASVPTPVPLPTNPQGFGGSLDGLTRELLDAFDQGRIEFSDVETAASGLGPIFKGRSCAECHSAPALGGGSNTRVTRFGRNIDGVFDAMEAQGGSLLQRFAINPVLQEVIPHEANVIAQRLSTPLFGLGLIEAIPDSVIVQNMLVPKPDGVRGKVAEITDVVSGQKRVGRFGWKAQQATLLAFAGDAYHNEIGITNRLFPKENEPNGNEALLARFKRTIDPEDTIDPATSKSDIDMTADFIRFLAPPTRLAATAQSAVGESLFNQAGCTACHTPVLPTGPNPIAALDRKAVNLYSDLLLHDMGSLNDGIAQAGAAIHEMKTPSLWGLRARGPYLHDGRATTLDAAIRAHDGEGAVARDRYIAMTLQLKRNLQEFLSIL